MQVWKPKILIKRLEELESENIYLVEQFTAVEKALVKEKTFHRKFVDEAVESEHIRMEDAKKEKRSLVEANKSHVKHIRQLTKDLSFYKQAYEEVSKEDDSTNTPLIKENRRLSKDLSFYQKAYEELSNNDESAHTSLVKENHQLTRDLSFYQKAYEDLMESAHTTSNHRTQRTTRKSTSDPLPNANKSSKALSKVAEKLLIENKKLQSKMIKLQATNQLMKKKIQQLENFKNKMMNKKLKFSKEVDELELLVASTKMKNKDTFTPEVLAKLRQLSND